jgi:hypothetical protein
MEKIQMDTSAVAKVLSAVRMVFHLQDLGINLLIICVELRMLRINSLLNA